MIRLGNSTILYIEFLRQIPTDAIVHHFGSIAVVVKGSQFFFRNLFMASACSRAALVGVAKISAASLLYTCFDSKFFPGRGRCGGLFESRLAFCEQASVALPLDLSIPRTEGAHIFYRVCRGFLRAGWIFLKLAPSFLTLPVAIFWSKARCVWWKYVIWVLGTSGPTAIKFAQWMGTRPDLFPESAIVAFSKFHRSSISEYSLESTRQDLDRIYGSGWSSWLEIIDKGALVGSGAIAHVSRGRIISGPHRGTEVALKIAHRGVRELVEADLDIMKFFAWASSKFSAFSSLDAPGAVEEFGKFMRSQTNLLTEADNINRFTVLFRDRPDVRFPKVFIDYCTRDILVESFERGIDLGDVIRDGSVKLKKKVCDIGVDAFLKMLFLDNFVHGDMHPGNVMFRPLDESATLSYINESGNIDGKVVLIDCGLIAQLGPRDETNFIDLMHAVVTGRSKEVGKLMIDRSRSPPGSVHEPEAFCEKVAKLVDTTVTGKSLLFGALEFGAVISQLLDIARQHKVRLETDFVSVAFALVVLEGVGKQLDPCRNLLWEAEPYILKQFLRRAKRIVLRE